MNAPNQEVSSTVPSPSPARRPGKFGRDLVLFTAGLLLTANEALLEQTERPTLLLLFAAMMGLPVMLRADERRSPKE